MTRTNKSLVFWAVLLTTAVVTYAASGGFR